MLPSHIDTAGHQNRSIPYLAILAYIFEVVFFIAGTRIQGRIGFWRTLSPVCPAKRSIPNLGLIR